MAREPTRRRLLQTLAAAGAGGVFARTVAALAGREGAVSVDMIRQAEWVSGLELTPEKRELMIGQLEGMVEGLAELRAVDIDNGVPPALLFQADNEPRSPGSASANHFEIVPVSKRGSSEDVAFSGIAELAGLLRSRAASSVELTRLYLDRIELYDPVLRCVISRTDDLAFAQAEAADREIAAGDYRGPLHGIPWGAKDILAVPGYRTTWGATPFREQIRPDHSTVVRRIEGAGGVLVAKTSVGALAWGDVWYDGTTKNPWNVEQGSSGSSAGSASATAAGLVGYAIGTETWGSIVSPCTRCGATGLRPTFGRVSRHGAMALAWSMDKIGPIARSAADCALVFDAIHGADVADPTSVSRSFAWPANRKPTELTIGYLASQFERDRTEGVEDASQHDDLREWQSHDMATLQTLRELGLKLVPIELPDRYPIDPLELILWAESAAAA